MTNKDVQQKDTAAWIFQVWASFILATAGTATGIIYRKILV